MMQLIQLGSHDVEEPNYEELNEKEFRTFRKILSNLTDPSTTCMVRIMQNNFEETTAHENNDMVINHIAFQKSVTLMPQLEKGTVMIKIDGLNTKEVKYVKEMCHTVFMRCSKNNAEKKVNDYYMTFDFVYLDEAKSRSYVMSFADTPLFCSGDGDSDLWIVFDAGVCFLSAERYDAHTLEYEAMVAEEEGNHIETIQDKIAKGY